MMQLKIIFFASLLLALQILESRAQFDGIPGMGAPCKPFSCSKGYAPVQKKRGLKFTSAGCDAMGGGAMMFTGNKEQEEKPYESCCDQWHACFQICGTNKQSCDDTFKKCVDTTCEETDEREKCQESAKITIMMLGLSPCKQFEGAQAKACECVPKENDAHLKKREEVLSKFYRLHAPDAKNKAPELIKKAETSAKFASLMRQLVKKYPGSIEHVEDPKQKQYREMMDKFSKERDEGSGNDEGAEEEEEIESDEHQEL